jgi:hypothetical protein
VTAQPRLARHYVRHFADIYLTSAALLPEFDVVTMFHLCEFYHSETSSVAYGGMTDRQLLDLFTRRTGRVATCCSIASPWHSRRRGRFCETRNGTARPRESTRVLPVK